MKKIKLANDQIFDLISVGADIVVNAIIFKITTELTYEEVKNIFLNYENICKIDLLDDETPLETYLNCKLLNTLSVTSSIINNERIDTYTVELKTDNTNELLAGLQLQINELNGKNLELQNENLELKEIIDALVVATLEV